MSEAGSAWTTLPPIVPRLRTCRSPIPRAHSAIAAKAGRRSTSDVDQIVPGRQRPDVQLAVALADAAEIEARDVDDERGPRDAQLHHGDERLPTGDRLGIGLGQELERVVEIACALVACRRRDHDAAAARTDSTIPWYPVQRQRFPRSACRISSSLGDPLRESRSAAVRMMPGVQKPHCSPWCSTNARCSGCSSPSDARPSMVVISRPSAWRRAPCSSSPRARRAGPCTRRTGSCRSRCARRSGRARRGARGRATCAPPPRASAPRR